MAAKDLYIVFNGMFLFDWGSASEKFVKVYVPKQSDMHKLLGAESLDLEQGVDLPTSMKYSIANLAAPRNGQRFDKDYSLAISGTVYDVNESAAFAKFTFPWPDDTYTSSFLIRHDNYVGKSEPTATKSPTHPKGVKDKRGVDKDAIAVSEVMVLRYKSTEATDLVWDGGSLTAIDNGASRLLGVFSLVKKEHAGHDHNPLFNALLQAKNSTWPPADYHPTSTYEQLEQQAAVPHATKAPSDVPLLWMKAKEAQLERGQYVIRSASGMGSCDNGNRCEDC